MLQEKLPLQQNFVGGGGLRSSHERPADAEAACRALLLEQVNDRLETKEETRAE